MDLNGDIKMNDQEFIQFCAENNINIQAEKARYCKKLKPHQKLQYTLDKHDTFKDKKQWLKKELLQSHYNNRRNNKDGKLGFYRNLNINKNIFHAIKLYDIIQK